MAGFVRKGSHVYNGANKAYAALKNGTFVENYPEHVIYLVNGKPATPQTLLHEGDSVLVLRKAHGG